MRSRRAQFAAVGVCVLLCLGGYHRHAPQTSALSPADTALHISLTYAPDPPRALDLTRFTVHLATLKNAPVDKAAVTLRLSMPQMSMPENQVHMAPAAHGDYVGTGRFTMSGDWQVGIEAHTRQNTVLRAVRIAVR